jgi:hypothetical protein
MGPARRNSRKHEHRLTRRAATRTPRATILIVCEGAKTETSYFKAMKADPGAGLTSVHVDVLNPGADSAPISVVRHALNQFKVRQREAKTSIFLSSYDQVFCVMDKDQHASLGEALDLIEASSRTIPITGILSCPCFEIWYLLHFRFSTMEYQLFRELESELRREIPGYTKALDVYHVLKPHLAKALRHAGRLELHHAEVSTTRVPNPSTEVHHLVAKLLSFTGQGAASKHSA